MNHIYKSHIYILCSGGKNQGKLIQPNSSWSGGPIIITNNQTLIIQRIDRRWTGLFTCVASNVEGDGESNALAVNIKCKFPYVIK